MSDERIQTGLVALAPSGVAQPVEQQAVNLPVAGSSPAPGAIAPASMPDGWTIARVAKLVRDLSTNMYELPFVLKTHGLTQEQYDRLAATEAFKSTLTAMTIEWNAIGNTKKRLELESAIYLEDGLPIVAARLSKSTEPLEAVVALAKLLGTFAGLGSSAQTNAPSEKFKIVFNLGADVAGFDKSRPLVQIQTDSEGAGNAEPVQQFIQGPGTPPTV